MGIRRSRSADSRRALIFYYIARYCVEVPAIWSIDPGRPVALLTSDRRQEKGRHPQSIPVHEACTRAIWLPVLRYCDSWNSAVTSSLLNFYIVSILFPAINVFIIESWRQSCVQILVSKFWNHSLLFQEALRDPNLETRKQNYLCLLIFRNAIGPGARITQRILSRSFDGIGAMLSSVVRFSEKMSLWPSYDTRT